MPWSGSGSGANTVDVAAGIRREAERINRERDDVHLTVVSDQSEFIRQSIASVRSSALWGSLLAVAVLYFFLRRRSSTAIITVAIPISVVATEVRGDSAAVELKLEPRDRRSMGSTEMADRVRRVVDGQIPGAEVDAEAQQGLWMLNRVFSSGGGSAVEIELRGCGPS